ncbi:hypothetical protein ABPG72_009141, partial [Tetrahymena utriculariae]
VFGQVLKYPLHEVHNCQVIGQLKVNIIGISKYAILYVNYEKDGEIFLGYGCLDGQNMATSGIKPLAPYQLYQFGDYYGCSDSQPDESYFYTFYKSRNLHYDAYPNKRSIKFGNCLEYWTFSQVKLASWMCLPQNYPFNSLTSTFNKCYISNYGNSKKAKLNSQYRANLKNAQDFTLVGFSNFLIPIHQYIIFLIFCYCPFIVTSNLKKFQYIPYQERVQQDYTILKVKNQFYQPDKINNFCEIKQYDPQTFNQNDKNVELDNLEKKDLFNSNCIKKEVKDEVIILKEGEQNQQFNQQGQFEKFINL